MTYRKTTEDQQILLSLVTQKTQLKNGMNRFYRSQMLELMKEKMRPYREDVEAIVLQCLNSGITKAEVERAKKLANK